ncbi:metallothionein-like protein type 2 [Apium graveolens]|uniref:Metallothionein-like protein n=1 Tax=Apium graveolens TaxID=4045 RepID=A0A6L5BB01_APIGR|nr:hypothetical protein AG4045_001422 [Apium graveolens]
MSDCCGGKCTCGSGCKCGTGCTGCGMYPDMINGNASETLIAGLAPQISYTVGCENEMGAENDGCKCKCGDKCTCNPCTCK